MKICLTGIHLVSLIILSFPGLEP